MSMNRGLSIVSIAMLLLGVLLIASGPIAAEDANASTQPHTATLQSPYTNTLYVSSNAGSFRYEKGYGEITAYDLDSFRQLFIVVKQSAARQLHQPEDGTCNPDGVPYFVDLQQGTVFRLGAYGTEPIAEVAHPESLAFDADGHLYVVANDGIYAIPNGEATDAPVHVSSYQFGRPGGIVVLTAGPYAGDILAVDQDADRVWRFPRPSAASFDLGTPEVFIDSGLDRPIGIALDSAGDVFVGNFNSKRILQYGPDGVHIGMLGSGVDLRLNRPIHMEFDDADNLFMASWGDKIGDGWVSMFNPTTEEFRFVGPLIDAWGLTVCRAAP